MGQALRHRYHQLRHSSKDTPPMTDSTTRTGNLKNPFINLLQALNMDFLDHQLGLDSLDHYSTNPTTLKPFNNRFISVSCL
jgi:hypothetical protein